jgi:hypothetical protein
VSPNIGERSEKELNLRKPARDLSAIDRRIRIFDADNERECALAARMSDLLGRAERSSPKAASRRAEGAGLDGEGADRAIIHLPQDTLLSDNVRRIGYQFLQLISSFVV